MADNACPGSDVGDDPFLSDWEMSCLDEWDKSFVMEDRRIQAETEKSSHRLWSSFQNSASAVSQLYKDGLQSSGVSLWIPFQSAAGHVTGLYKDSQELISRSFELGNQMGHYRRNKELISWLRKRRRTLPREEIIAFICEKPAPVTRHKSYGRGANSRRVSEITSPKFLISSPTRDFSAENDFQPFRDPLALQGWNGSTSVLANPGVTRRPNSTSERLASLMTDDLQCCLGSQKRVRSGDMSSPGSPSHKRAKICGMETEDL